MLRLPYLRTKKFGCNLIPFRKITLNKGSTRLVHVSANINTDAEVKMADLLQRNAPDRHIFDHIAANSSKDSLSPELVEDFMISLLKRNNLSGVTFVAHVVLDANDGDPSIFSNQFWSLLVSNACSLCHYSAGLLVYHEIVNPVSKYSQEDQALVSEENEHIPFLLVPTSIEGLAQVFAQNGNTALLQGLRSYFQRFYSYMGHSETYKTLQALIIESYALNGDFDNALDRFCDFAMKFRAHGQERSSGSSDEALLRAVEQNFGRRELEIGRAAPKPGGKPKITKSSKIHYNKYTISGQKFNAIFEGDLNVADLPLFYALLNLNIKGLISNIGGAYLESLVFLMTKSHHSLGKFIIQSLCEQGKCFEAVHILKRIIAKYKYALQNPEYSLGAEYIAIFQSIQRLYKKRNGVVSTGDRNLLSNTFDLYCLYGKGFMVHSCYSAYLQAFLSDSKVTEHEVTQELLKYNPIMRITPVVSTEIYEKVMSLGVSPNLIKRHNLE